MLIRLLALLVLGSFWPQPAATADIKTPSVSDARLQLSLLASEPEVMTPIGLAVNQQGRVFVLESHTHFPPADYPGPKHDLVKIFDPSIGDGKTGRISVFAGDLKHAMNLSFGPDHRLYVTHRNGVLRLDDRDNDGVSESRVNILQMETPGDYPHNGLGGIAFSRDGWLYVGQGENLGERYALEGTDGRVVRGGGEGGNVSRCRPDGSELEQVATGFWNPFALAFFDDYLLAVDNDPDSRPPNRLLDVVAMGDYGFKFRFGRSGLHPFQAWNGELPGTLPMVAGIGEGASGLLPCHWARLPENYRDALLVTSWGDHRIEVYHPKPAGASLRAEREVLVQGNEWFRPVAIAAAPDGSVLFSDWVDVSYPVHRKGRVWRLSAKPNVKTAASTAAPAIASNAARSRMQRLTTLRSVPESRELIEALADPDPFIRSAAVGALSRSMLRELASAQSHSKSAPVRLGALLALRRAQVTNAPAVLKPFLSDPDEDIRLMAVIWAGEARLTELTNELKAALTAGPVSTALLRAHAAASQMLAAKPTRAGSLTNVPPISASAEGVRIFTLENNQHGTRSGAPRVEIPPDARSIAANRSRPEAERCQAIAELARDPVSHATPLLALLRDRSPAVRVEAARALRGAVSEPLIKKTLRQTAEQLRRDGNDPALFEEIALPLALSGAVEFEARPRPSSDEEWRQVLSTPGNADAGERAFFHPVIGCAKCHRIEDQGEQIGPDLSTIARGADREKLMQSILHPSRDIAPQFVQHIVETKDGETFSGVLLGQEADGTVTLFLADGKAALIPGFSIASHTQSKVSMMPEDLAKTLTVQALRDLLAYLLSRK